MKEKRTVALILIGYFIASSIPGLLGIEAATTQYALYQAGIFGALFLCVIYTIFRDKIRGSSRSLRFISIYATLLLLTAISGAYTAIRFSESLLGITQLVLPPIIGIILLLGFGNLRATRNDVIKVASIVVLFLVFSSLYNIVINYSQIISLSSITNSYEADLKGFYSNRNVFGYMMAVGVSLSIFLLMQTKKKIHILFIAIMALSMFAAMSRGGILFAILCVGLFVVMKYKMKAIAPLILLSLFIPAILSHPFVADNIVRSDNGDTGRSSLREFGINYFLDNNLVTGSGQHAITEIEQTFEHNSYHNLYIETLTTQGLLGIAAVVAGFIFSYSRIKVVKKYDKDTGRFLLAFLIAYGVYVMIEALPLFYATPNSIITTYILILAPLFITNSHSQRKQSAL